MGGSTASREREKNQKGAPKRKCRGVERLKETLTVNEEESAIGLKHGGEGNFAISEEI